MFQLNDHLKMIHWAIVVHLKFEIYEIKINVNIWASSTSVSSEECLVFCIIKYIRRMLMVYNSTLRISNFGFIGVIVDSKVLCIFVFVSEKSLFPFSMYTNQ